MVKVWFIRHAESEANAGLPTLDPITTKITPKGHQEAHHIAAAFTQPPSLIVTSPYFRTKETAQPTIDRFPDVPHEEWFVQEFTFLAPAQYCNTTVHDRVPMVEAYLKREDPFYVDGEGAESFVTLIERVQQVRSKIETFDDFHRDTEDEPFVVIFSHGRFMRAVLWTLLHNPAQITLKEMRAFWSFVESFPVPNGAILKAQFRSSEMWFSPIITSHLTQPCVRL